MPWVETTTTCCFQAATDLLANIARLGMGFANVFSLPLMFSGLREATLVLLSTAVPDADAWPLTAALKS